MVPLSPTLRQCDCPSSPKSHPSDQNTADNQQLRERERRSQRMRPCKNLSVCIPEQPSLQIHPIESLEEISPQHIAELWFIQDEINATIRDCAETVKQMQVGIPLCGDTSDNNPDAEFTSRGLEYCTPDGFDITTSSLDVVKLILEEQERQQQAGEKDVEMLAAAVGGISRHRMRIAHLAAMRDARAAYGNERLNITAAVVDDDSGGAPMTLSNSFWGMQRERRGRRVRRSGSFGALEDKVRRRRGSRGPLGDNASSSTRDQRRVNSDSGPQTSSGIES